MAQSAYQTPYQFPSQLARPAAFGGGHGQPHFQQQQQQPPPGGPGHNPAAAYQPPGSLPPGLQTPEAFAYHDGVGGTTTAATSVIQTTGAHHPGGPYAQQQEQQQQQQQQQHSPANASPQPQQSQHFAPDAALAQRQHQHQQYLAHQHQQRTQGLQQQQSQTQQQIPSAAKFPMAAPPLPVSPANAPSQQQQQQQQPPPQAVRSSHNNNGALSPATPQSPGAQSRDQQRIGLLFDINVQLLQEVNRLQSEGQGGAINPAQQATLRGENKPDKMASEQYIQCLRRVQANLGYLMPKAQTNAAGDQQQQQQQQAAAAATKTPPGPAHMTPPPHMPQLMPLYERLRELFPGWQGIDHRMSSSSAAAAAAGAGASPRSNVGGGVPTSSTAVATTV